MPDLTPEQIQEQQADRFISLNEAPHGTILMRAYGGMWRIMSAAGEAEHSSLAGVIQLASHRGLLEK